MLLTKIKYAGSGRSVVCNQIVTLCAAVCINIFSFYPLLIFPRNSFKGYFISNGLVGSIAGTIQPGQMTKHFEKHMHCTKEKPVLILFYNHISRLVNEKA